MNVVKVLGVRIAVAVGLFLLSAMAAPVPAAGCEVLLWWLRGSMGRGV
jgi:hypothetical protein